MAAEERGWWTCWWPFIALCLLASSRWIIAARWPDTTSTLASEAAGCGLAALLLFAAAMFSRRREPLDRSASLASAAAGALIVAGPAVGLLAAFESSSSDLLIALALTPIVAAVALAATGEAPQGLAGRLWPGLAALAGLLLMLPQPSVSDLRTDAVLALSALLPGLGAVWLSRGGADKAVARLVAALSGAGLVFGVALLVQLKLHMLQPEFSNAAALLDGALAALGLLALLRLGTMRWAAQFALVPLVVTIEGLLLLRPRLDWRLLLGLGLLLAATVYLLLPPPEDDAAGDALHLR